MRGIWFLRPFYLFISFIYLFLSALGSLLRGPFSSCSERGRLVSRGPRASHCGGGFSLPSTGSRHAGSSSCLQSECRDSSPNNQTHTHTHNEVLSMKKKHPILTNWETTIIPVRMSKILHTHIGDIGFLKEPFCVVCS